MVSIIQIDHVQLAMPKGEEARARAFYRDVLGMTEIEKPPGLAKRGGAWFKQGSVQIHLGVEENFVPAKKAHPAFSVGGGAGLRQKLTASGYAVRDDDMIPGTKRFYTDDCFGNRIEFIELE